MNGIDLATYTGILTIAWLITHFVGNYVDWFTTKRKPLLALASTLVLGIVSKRVGIGFADTVWAYHIIALIVAGVSIQVVHDKLLKPLAAIRR